MVVGFALVVVVGARVLVDMQAGSMEPHLLKKEWVDKETPFEKIAEVVDSWSALLEEQTAARILRWL